jgi:prolipoprotein diacylglyceryltransferase
VASPGTTVAFLPSPGPGTWHLGLLPVRGYALCIVLGILVGVRVANRRYLRLGGRPGVILDVATWAVPAGLIGARLYSVITDYELYFKPGRDWIDIFRVWDGGIGMPGAAFSGPGSPAAAPG